MPLDTGVFDKLRTVDDYQRAEQEFQLKKQLAAQKLLEMQSGDNLPAALQLANEYQKRVAAGDVQGANLLAQFAKTQDRGLIVDTNGTYQAAPGYAPAVSSIAGSKKGAEEYAKKSVDLKYDPLIEANKKTASANAGKTTQANDSISTLDEIETPDAQGKSLLDKATGSGIGATYAAGKGLFGVSDESTQANAALSVLGNRLVLNTPRMEGPQSDKDAALYKAMAGRIADPSIPASDKKAAILALRQISQKYSGPMGSLDDLLNNYQPSQPVNLTSPDGANVDNGMSLKEKSESIFNAKKAIKAGKNPQAIKQKLLDAGINPKEAGL